MYIPNFILQVFFKLIWQFLTWLNLWPLLHLDPFVLKFYATIAKDHPDDLSPSTTVKVQQFNFRSHFDYLQRDGCCSVGESTATRGDFVRA